MNEKQVIRWEQHYSDGSIEFIDEINSKNFNENLSCVSALLVSRSYIKMKPVKWQVIKKKRKK